MIDGKDDEVTFSSLLKTFYAKAEVAKIPMKPTLDFIFEIAKNFDELTYYLRKPMRKFIKNEEIKTAIEALPVNINITFINNLIKNIDILNQEIRSNIVIDPTFNNDAEFIRWYKQWAKSPVKREYVENVRKTMIPIKKELKKIEEEFISDMTDVYELRVSYKKDIRNSKGALADCFEATDPVNRREKIKVFESFVRRIVRKLPKLLQSLENVNDTLKTYNSKRMSWAEFLIGMRISPYSVRSTPENIRKLSARSFR